MSTSKKSKTTKKEITGKQYGQNVVLMIDKKKFSKRFPNKEDRELIFEKIEKYNKRNSKKLESEIIEMMQKDNTESSSKEAVKEKVKQKTKSTQKPKAASTKTKEEKIAEAKKLLEENEYTVAKKVGTTPRAPRRRGGEY